MLLPNRFLLLVMIGKFLFLLPQPLGMEFFELLYTFIIKSCLDGSVLCLDNGCTDSCEYLQVVLFQLLAR